MPRPRVPTTILEARGSFEKHPERKRARAAEPEVIGELGEAPASLDVEEGSIWKELALLLTPGVAGGSDRSAFEELVRLKARSRKRELNAAEQGLLLNYLVKFGMTPSDRSRVAAPRGENADALDRFLANRRAQ